MPPRRVFPRGDKPADLDRKGLLVTLYHWRPARIPLDIGMQTDNRNLFVWSPNRLDSLNLLLAQFKIPSRFFRPGVNRLGDGV